MFSDLADEVRIITARFGRLYDDPHRLAEAHAPLLKALMARDSARYAKEIDYHLGVARQTVIQSFQVHSTT